jgi:uncharacterized alpha-E superfamily protein
MILCRDAEAGFWMGRYIERTEATARMVDVHFHAGLEQALHSTIGWEALIDITGSGDDFRQRYPDFSDENVLYWLIFDPKNPNAICSTWTMARENARRIREQIASEIWETVNGAYLELSQWNIARLLEEGPHGFFLWIKNQSHLFQGIFNRTQLFGEMRDWIDAGRFLERADQTTRLLDVKYHSLLPVDTSGKRDFGGTLDIHGWISVLRSVSAFEMYRKMHHEGIHPAGIVQFLVQEKRFPASVYHCTQRVQGCLHRIGEGENTTPTMGDTRVAELLVYLEQKTAKTIIAEGLHEYLDEVQLRLGGITDAVWRTYLTFS